MKRWAAVLALAAACGGDPIADEELAIRVAYSANEIGFGEGFDLVVTRTWSSRLVPSVWSDEALAPLVLDLRETNTREDAERVEETRRYRAFAFQAGAVVVPALAMRGRPRGGGPVVSAAADPIELNVRPLDAYDPVYERPDGPWSPKAAWPWWVAAAVALLALVALARRKPAPEPVVEEPTEPEISPRDRALAALTALRDAPPTDEPARHQWYGDLAAVVRGIANAAEEWTTEEVLARWRGAGESELRAVLSACDFVKFADLVPSDDARQTSLDTAEAFVREVAP